MINLNSIIRAGTLPIIFAAVGLIVGCGGKSKQVTPPELKPGSVLLVANAGGGSGYITIVDITDSTVRIGATPLGGDPSDILRLGSRLFVINRTSNNMNILEISDQNVLSLKRTVDLPGPPSRAPTCAALADNGIMFITNFNANTVTVLDTSTMAAVRFIPVGPGPKGILAYQDKVYVCNSGDRGSGTYDPGTVSIISTVSLLVIDTIDVGLNPQYIGMAPGHKIHVVCSGNYADVEGEIYEIDADADNITQVVSIGGSPEDVAVAGNVTYVTARGNALEGRVYRYDTFTGRVLNGPRNPIVVAARASRIIADGDSAVFVACSDGDIVQKIVGDAKSESYAVGDGPGAMALIKR